MKLKRIIVSLFLSCLLTFTIASPVLALGDYQSLSLSGAGYASITDASQAGLNMGLSDFMVEARFKTTATSTQYLVIKMSSSSPYAGYAIYFTNEGKIQVDVQSSNSANSFRVRTNSTFNDGRWHALGVVVDRSQVSADLAILVYVDGNLQAVTEPAQIGNILSSIDNTNAFFLGVLFDGSSNKFTGLIDEVRVWNFGYGGLPADYEAYITWRNTHPSHDISQYAAGAWNGYADADRTEKVTDGGLEDWSDATHLVSWMESGVSAGVRDITRESTEKHSGSYAAKLEATLNDGVTYFELTQNVVLVPNKYYEASVWIYYPTRTAGDIATYFYNITDGSWALVAILASTNAEFTNYKVVGKPTVADSLLGMRLNNETTTGVVYFDDISVKRVGLVGHWGFDGDYVDQTANANTLTAGGAGNTFVAGMTNTIVTGASLGDYQSLSLDGSGYASIADASQAGLNMGLSDFMIEARVKTTVGGIILAKSNGGSPASNYGYLLLLTTYDGRLYIYLSTAVGAWGDAGNFQMISSTDLRDGRWHTIVMVIDRSSSINCSFFVDGSDDTQIRNGDITTVGNIFNDLNFTVGAESDTGDRYTGLTDEVRVWNFGFGGLPADYEAYITWRNTHPSHDISQYAAGAWNGWADADRSELLINGDMEAVDSWANRAAVNTNVRSNEQAHTLTFSRKIVTDAISEGAQQDVTTVVGEWYEVRGWAYVTVGDAKIGKEDVDGSDQVLTSQATAASWNEFCVIFQATETTSRIFFQSDTTAVSTFYVDDMETRRIGNVAHYGFDGDYVDQTANANTLTAGGAGNTFVAGMTDTVICEGVVFGE